MERKPIAESRNKMSIIVWDNKIMHLKVNMAVRDGYDIYVGLCPVSLTMALFPTS